MVRHERSIPLEPYLTWAEDRAEILNMLREAGWQGENVVAGVAGLLSAVEAQRAAL